MARFLVVALVGRLVIHLAQKFPLPKFLSKTYFFRELFGCDLCLGVWVFSILAWVYPVKLLHSFGFSYLPFFEEILSGMIISFVVHIFRLGWEDKFQNVTYTIEG